MTNERSRQLADAEAQLAVARQRYSADHPDVVRLERLVESLKAVPVEPAISSPPLATPTTTAAPKVEPADNPTYIQLNTQRQVTLSQRSAMEAKYPRLKKGASSDEYTGGSLR